MRKQLAAILLGSLALAGCSGGSPYTLYRNSSMDQTMRVRWATFDASESSARYNLDNCKMAARLLNANMKALSGDAYDPSRGFWCEPGTYEGDGTVPSSFAGKFPTDTE